ncbi:hypothetical protein ACWCRC_32560 [Streptomyces sp. NPDC001940]
MTTRAPKTRTAPVPAEEGGILALTTAEQSPMEEPREALFSVDGEEFTVPKVIDERLAYLAMNKMRTEGAIFGGMYLQELILGEAQFARLIELYEQRKITQEQFDQVGSLINNLLFERAKDDTDTAGKA